MVMVSRGLALSLCLAMASIAQAQVDIELVPLTAGPYIAGQRVRVSAEVTQTSGATRHARLIQFDVNATDPELNVLSPTTHDGGTPGNTTDDIRLWDFRAGTSSTVPNWPDGCESDESGDGTADPATCGDGYLINSSLTDTITPGLGTAWIAFIESAQNATLQITLPNGVATKVAEFDIDIPAGTPDGDYTFDVVNAAAGPDGGAKVHWGFGMTGDTITTNNASAITGGSVVLQVRPPGGCDLTLVSSEPDCGVSLWRSAKNFIELTFDGPAVAPGPGEIQIRELLAGGAFGADLSANFTFTPNGNVLRIDEVTPSLTHRTWYAITADGSGSYCEFERDHPVQVGDANADGRVVSFDVSVINGGNPCFACPDDRRDINGDNRITSFDVSVTNGSIPSFPVTKPDGHACTP